MFGSWMLHGFFSSPMPGCSLLPGSVFLPPLLLFWTAVVPRPISKAEEMELSVWVFILSIVKSKRLFLFLSHQKGLVAE